MTTEEAMQIAMQHHRAGRLVEAEEFYRQVLAQDPNHAKAVYFLGALAGQAGRAEEAVELIRRAISLNPNFAEAHCNLAAVLRGIGRPDEAIAACNRAIQLKPDYAEAYSNLGVALEDKGRLDEAIAAYSRAIELKPTYAEAHNNLGNTLRDKGRLDESVAAFNRAIQLKPDYAEAHTNLGVTLREMGRLDEAAAAHSRAIQLKPNYAQAHNNLGNALTDMGRLDEAIAACDQAIRQKPDFVEAHSNLANALKNNDRLDEAIAAYNRAIQLNPNYADAHMNLGMVLLLLGDFQRGWPEYESRWNAKPLSTKPRRFSQPRWDGSDLHGKTIFLHAEQGLGDAIQFIRYVPLVAARGGRVVVECLPPLKRLFENIEQISQLVCDGKPRPEFDVQCPLLSLPLVMGTDRLEAIPANVPYVRPPAAAVEYWRDRLRGDGENLKVGLAWAGSPKNPSDRHRSLQLQWLAPLAGVEKVTFYSLQLGPPAQQAHFPPPGMNLINCAEGQHDFADTAGLVANLDLVISVDTSVAHLAGAMGKPAWTLLKFSPDWRWLLGRDDSPWYPTMRLFRQPRAGDWAAAIQAVAEQLRVEAARHH